jgi:transposase-like protein
MVEAVRRGKSLQRVANEYHVAKATVSFWVKRAKDKRLDRTDWTDRSSGQEMPHNRTATHIEQCVLRLRKYLKENSPLGEHGADAIKDEMERLGCIHPLSRPTINRILPRNGMFDGKRRQWRPPPPTGWYLPDVANGLAELDQFDFVEDLCLEGSRFVHVFNGISLHGRLVMSCPESQMRAENTVRNLILFWKEFGLPNYAQFDNSSIFLGAHWADSLGRVSRFCLSLGVIPVFVPPHETGFQASIESYNGRWQKGVWQRFRFENLNAVQLQSEKYVKATRDKNASRRDATPPRWEFPRDWQLNYQQPPKGKVIFIRRTNAQGHLDVMGHHWILECIGPHRLVRAEVHLTKNKIDFYRLRRREPDDQQHLGTAEYRFPSKLLLVIIRTIVKIGTRSNYTIFLTQL